MKLLAGYEILDYTPEMVNESKLKNGGKIILRGLMQKADALNQNGRVYSKAILDREVRNYQKLIIENRALGECDHPDSSVINLKNVSHIVRELKMDGNEVIGAIELLDTPCGKIAQSLVESGVKLGISSRGVGSTTTENGAVKVQDDFILIGFDLVSEPSTTQAFMLPEGKMLFGQAHDTIRNIMTRSDRIDRIMNSILNK